MVKVDDTRVVKVSGTEHPSGGICAFLLNLEYNPEFYNYKKDNRGYVFVGSGDGHEGKRINIINSIKDTDLFDVFLFVGPDQFRYIGRYCKVCVFHSKDPFTSEKYSKMMKKYNRVYNAKHPKFTKEPKPLEFTKGCGYVEIIVELIKVERVVENLKKYNTDLLVQELNHRGYSVSKLGVKAS